VSIDEIVWLFGFVEVFWLVVLGDDYLKVMV